MSKEKNEEKEKTKKVEGNKVAEVKKKIFRDNALSLRIARVPIETKKQFIDLADKEFCGDYGMALKWLMMDRWDKLLGLELRIAKLESAKSGKAVIVRTMLNGREIEVKSRE